MHTAFISFEVPGLEDRNCVKDVSRQIRNIVNDIEPDVVYIHNIFDGRIAHSLRTSDRRYLLFWYVHDHYLTCLTELRAQTESLCKKPLSPACLDQINKGNCIKRFIGRDYTTLDLNLRLKLLNSIQVMDRVIVISEYMRDILLKNEPNLKGRISVLPRQVRDSDYIVNNSLSLGKKDVKATFSIAGAIEKSDYWKECTTLIEEVKNKNIHVEYLGLLSYEKTDELYKKINILIVPSLWGEPFGVVGAEALAHSVAVIASDAGGISTYMKNRETGLLVKLNDPSAIAKAITTFYKDRALLSRTAKRGKSLIAKEFNSQIHFRSLSRIIDKAKKLGNITEASI